MGGAGVPAAGAGRRGGGGRRRASDAEGARGRLLRREAWIGSRALPVAAHAVERIADGDRGSVPLSSAAVGFRSAHSRRRHAVRKLQDAWARTWWRATASAGVRFAVWAPNAEVVSVVGDFNDWDERRHPMRLRSGGVWELFVPGRRRGTNYKYSVRSRLHAYRQQKADPYGFQSEDPPQVGVGGVRSRELSLGRSRRGWRRARRETLLKEPVSIYEVHLGSWLRGPHNKLSDVSRTGVEAGGLRQDHGLHAHRIAAADGASVFRFVGLPGGRAIMRRRRASARRRISCTSWTAVIRRASA